MLFGPRGAVELSQTYRNSGRIIRLPIGRWRYAMYSVESVEWVLIPAGGGGGSRITLEHLLWEDEECERAGR